MLLRGTMSASDWEAIISGAYLQPFVPLENVHWVESVWNEQDGSWAAKVTAYGRDKEWRWHTGTTYFRTESIFTISELRDCSPLLGRSHEASQGAE